MMDGPFLFREPKIGGALAYCPESGGVFQLDEAEYQAVKERSEEGLKLIEEMKAYKGNKYTLNDFIGHLNSLGIIKERLSSPASVIFELTKGCNLRCSHCIVSAGEPLPNELKTKEWLKLINEISDYTVRLTLTGGEPLTHPGFFEILAQAKEKGLAVRILTNGTLLEDKAERLANLFDEWDEVQVSLDGMKAVNDRIRGEGSFERTVEGIKALLREGVKVSVAFTLIPENKGEVEELYRFVDGLGVSSFNVGWGVPLGRLKERVPYREYLETTEGLRKLGLGTPVAGGTLGDPLPVKPDSFYSCEAGTSQVFVSSTGDVYPCLMLMHPAFRMGSVREESLTEIWRKRDWERLKRDLRGTRCEFCPLFPRCRGGCPGEALFFRGSINEPAPNCRLEAGWRG